jgi:hypothetical protein
MFKTNGADIEPLLPRQTSMAANFSKNIFSDTNLFWFSRIFSEATLPEFQIKFIWQLVLCKYFYALEKESSMDNL